MILSTRLRRDRATRPGAVARTFQIRCAIQIWLAVLCIAPACCAADAGSLQPILLPDGVRLILRPDPAAQTVGIAVFVRTPRDVGPFENAVGTIVAHALWYGSTERTRDWTAHTVDQVGGVLETLRTPDYVACSCVTIAGRVEEAADMFCEMLSHADFMPEALAHARHDMIDERRRRSESGFAAAEDRVRSAIAGLEEPDEALIGAVTPAQAREYFRTHYLPAQTVIAVTGGFSPTEVQTDFEAHLYEYTRRTRTQPDLSVPADRPVHVETSHPLSIAGDAAYALVGTSAPRVDSAEFPAYTVLHALLGSGHASRLFRRLRDRLGLGYQVGAVWRADLAAPMIAYLEWDAKGVGVGNATTTLKPDVAISRLNEQLDGVLKDPPGESEVARARGMAIGQDALRHERVRDRAFLLGWYEAMGVGCAYDARFPTLLRNVTRDDVLNVARRYLPSRKTVLALPSIP